MEDVSYTKSYLEIMKKIEDLSKMVQKTLDMVNGMGEINKDEIDEPAGVEGFSPNLGEMQIRALISNLKSLNMSLKRMENKNLKK